MRAATLVLSILLFCGCASQIVEPSYYLLRSQQALPSGELTPSKDFSLGKVVIASYLDQPGLVMETEGGQLRPARQNLWAEPVYEGVRNILFVEIAQAMGEELLPSKLSKGTTVVDIRISELHGTYDGEAKLVAYWWLERDGKVLSSYRFTEVTSLTASGYSALVDAETALLKKLSQKIAASLVAPAPTEPKA
jgi:uncharacterized lipoprotein YmbA|tara:strand:+ start:203 stop:781 length:579 start_codon:yes stop_codon:yes gene_type:complete